MRCILIGNYGVGNIGDEALREYFLTAFPDVQWTVLSASARAANEVPRLPFGLRSFFKPWWRTIGAIFQSDAVIFGGGSLFTDSESAFACWLWGWHALIARMLRKPVFLTFQGVGPFRNTRAESIARRVFRNATFVSVRDEKSLARTGSWQLKSQPKLTFDPAFALFSTYKKAESTRKILVIIPRGNSDEQFFVAVTGVLPEQWDEIRILLMQPDGEEKAIASRLQSMIAKPSLIIEAVRVDQLLRDIGSATKLVTQRYHGALAGLALGIPTIICPQTAGDKLDGLRSLQNDAQATSLLLEQVKRGEDALRVAMGSIQ